MTHSKDNDHPSNKTRARPKTYRGSNIPHWDVTNPAFALLNANTQVEERFLSENNFEDIMLTFDVFFHAGMNSKFFTKPILEDGVGNAFSHTAAVI